MGQAVVHFEVVGKDGGKLQEYYSQLFGWNINSDNPMNYGMVDGKDNKTMAATAASAAASARAPRATAGTSPSTSRCPTSRRRWRRPRASAGSA